MIVNATLVEHTGGFRLSGFFFWPLDESLIPLLCVRKVCSEAVGSCPRSCALVGELTSRVSTSVKQKTLTCAYREIQGIHFSVFIITSRIARDMSRQ